MSTVSSLLAPGTVFGRYRIDRVLGRGGMGSVYAAEQLEDGRLVALKVLATTLDSPVDRERFLREGKTAASINHPNTVYVYRTEEIEGSPTIAMELVDGGTLDEKVTHQGPLSVPEAVHDILEVIDGLDAAYRSGILHRDIKPANCFITRSGVVKVGDFGLSRPVEPVPEARLTQSGLFLGTPVFSSPEQLMGEKLDVRADIYAVGATLYYLLSGRLPYESENVARLIAAVVSGGPIPLSSRRPDLPPALSALVMKCLARNREDRFADYVALRAALAAFQPRIMEPAPLGRRLLAGIADGYALSILTTPVSVLVGIDVSDPQNAPPGQMLKSTLLQLPVHLLWFGALEGRFGWSPGKYLARLRVARMDGSLPGLPRGLARAFFLWLPTLGGALAFMFAEGSTAKGVGQIAVTLGLVALFFVRARPNNGFAAEHDRLTGTRVIRRTASAAFGRRSSGATTAEATPRVRDERVGPYVLLDQPGPARDVEVGYDRELARKVWIVRSPAGTPPTPAAERDFARTTSLRWLGGQRSEKGGWDAYAAVSGESLRERLRRSTDWTAVHHWIGSLVAELDARAAAGWPGDRISLDNVWITADDDAVILPFRSGESAGPSPDANDVLQAVAAAVLGADERVLKRQTWPLRSRTVLASIANGNVDHRGIHDLLRSSRDRSESLTAKKRALLWMSTVAPAGLFAVTVGALIIATLLKSELSRLAPLIDYLESTPSSKEEDRANRELVVTYVAGHYGQRITSRTTLPKPAFDPMTEREWAVADSVVAAHPSVSAAQLSAADRLVDSTWKGNPPGVGKPLVLLVMIFTAIPLLVTAIAGFLAALLARRGMIMRLYGLELVDSRGELAGRLRLFWRQAVIWLAPLLLWFAAVGLALGGATPVVIGSAVIGLALMGIAAYFGLRTPERSLAERLSGTMVVPE